MDFKWAIIYLQVKRSPAEKMDAKIQELLSRKKNLQGKKSTANSIETDEHKDKW